MSNGINAPYGLMAVESVSGDGATRKMKDYKIAVAANGSSTTGPIFFGDPVKFTPTTGTLANKTYECGLSIVPALNTANNTTPAVMVLGGFVGTFIGCRYTDPNTGRTITSNYWSGNTVMPGTNVTCFVNDDPNTIFKVQMSTSDTNAANNNQNGNSSSIFQNWMVGQNALLQLGGAPLVAPIFNPVSSLVFTVPAQNPVSGNAKSSKSAVYLDGSSISLLVGGTPTVLPNVVPNNPGNPLAAGIPAVRGNPGFDVKIIGLAPSSSVSMGLATAVSPYNTLTPGVSMPFCDLLVKFNNHVYGSQGTPGPAWIA